MHSELEEFFVVLTALPSVLCHLLAEVVESVCEKCVSVYVCELTALLLCKFNKLRIDSSRNLTRLAENHTPHRVVHHYEASLALLESEKVHEGDVLHVLRERSNQWRITYARPYILHLIEELDEKVVHRELLKTVLLAYVINSSAHTAKVGHH